MISETETALIDTIRTLIDILVVSGASSAEEIDRLLAIHQSRHEAEKRIAAAGTIGIIRHLTTGPDVQQQRTSLLALRIAKPEGTA